MQLKPTPPTFAGANHTSVEIPNPSRTITLDADSFEHISLGSPPFLTCGQTALGLVECYNQVRGFCVDKSNHELFEDVNVYGNIYDSDIHHNNFGVYTYGHQQGDWRRNKMHDNSGYGFDPHDDSDFLTIHDNEVYDNGYHGIIASKRCNGVSIQVRPVWFGRILCAAI